MSSRDTILQQKSRRKVLQPHDAPLLMEYLTKFLEQLVDFIRVLRLSSIDSVDFLLD